MASADRLEKQFLWHWREIHLAEYAGRVRLFLEIIILIIIAKYFKTMYYVLNTGSELSGAQKGRNIQITFWSLQSKTLSLQDTKQQERWKVCRLHSTISNYSNSVQRCRPLKSVKLFLLCPFSWDGTQEAAEGTEASVATACLGGYLPPSRGPSPPTAPALRQRHGASGRLCLVLVRVREFCCLGEECCYV